jgi:hypothetical protein
MLLAATPATMLWYGLSCTREGIKHEVGQLKAAMAQERGDMQYNTPTDFSMDNRGLRDKKSEEVMPTPGRAGREDMSAAGARPEERIARLEVRLAALERLSESQYERRQNFEKNTKGSDASDGGGPGEPFLSGVRRRMLSQLEEGTIEAFLKMKGRPDASEESIPRHGKSSQPVDVAKKREPSRQVNEGEGEEGRG